tara:strand:- start:134 stop:796 length:663 start_codon:yes stop_codon:yes gene_type:complete
MTEVEINGYHGGFSSNVGKEQLQKCSENEINDTFIVNHKASIKSDDATVNYENLQSMGPGTYKLDNTYGCDCGLEKSREVQLSQPNINFSGGYGWMGEGGCLIDNDSDLRSNNLTNQKYINQLDAGINHAFQGKGPFDVDNESIIRDRLIIKDSRSCGPLSGSSTYNLTVTPMIEKLTNEVQNVKNIIPEDSMNSWVRGGLPTRQIVRNKEYMKRLTETK